MLKPLIKLLINQGVSYSGFLDMLKTTYVEVAEESFTLENKRQTDSRISLLTGVHRGDVKKIRNELKISLSDKEIKASKSAQIMAIWTGHQAYLDSDGKPASLAISCNDNERSFEQLVLNVSKDKHPRSVLDDWLSQDRIMIEENRVTLKEIAYVPSKDFEEKLFFAGKNIGEHLSVVAHNLANSDDPKFDRAVYYSNLSQDSAEQLETNAQKKLMNVLVEINAEANQLKQQDILLDDANYSIHIGSYFNKKANS